MINLKLLKWGVVASLALGLTGCYMDGQRAQQEPYQHHNKHASHTPATNDASAHQATAKKAKASSSKEPVQQEAPGPKRAAAPQIPVIQ